MTAETECADEVDFRNQLVKLRFQQHWDFEGSFYKHELFQRDEPELLLQHVVRTMTAGVSPSSDESFRIELLASPGRRRRGLTRTVTRLWQGPRYSCLVRCCSVAWCRARCYVGMPSVVPPKRWEAGARIVR